MQRRSIALGLLAIVLLPATVGAEERSGRSPRTTPTPEIPEIMFIPTPQDVVEAMLTLAEVKREDVVYDLGCGDGRIVVRAAQRFGCKAVGIDIDPLRIETAKSKVAQSRLEKLVEIRQGDLFEADLRPATVVMLYLHPKYNTRLIPQLKTLPPGSRVVSHLFDMPGVKPDKVLSVTSKETGKRHVLYLWKTPLKLADGSGAGAE